MSQTAPLRLAAILCSLIAVASCAAPPPTATIDARPAPRVGGPDIWSTARIVAAKPPLECVTYARQVSDIDLSGDAWTWWDRAAGRYERGSTPQAGAVLVFGATGNSTGHVAVVRRIVDGRLIAVDHANWLNRGEIFESAPVRDVSPRNDWSAVQVWHMPSRSWGITTYRTYGFIYPQPAVAAGS